MESKIKVLVVKPMKEPFVKEIENRLRPMQDEVKGNIEILYPYDDPVALVCNDEGKLMRMSLNRALRMDGRIYDIISGTFLVVAIDPTSGEFLSLSEEMQEKYTKLFHYPESFIVVDGKLVAMTSEGMETVPDVDVVDMQELEEESSEEESNEEEPNDD